MVQSAPDKPTPIKAKTPEVEAEQPQGITLQEAFDEACRLIGEKAVLDQLHMKRAKQALAADH